MKQIIKKHQTLLARLILLALVVFPCSLCVFFPNPEFFEKSRGLEYQTAIELDKIQPPNNTYILPGHEKGVLSKGRGIKYIRLYKSTLSYYAIYAHYIKEMKRNGWVMTRDDWLEPPYRVFFEKEQFKVELIKSRTSDDPDTYALTIGTQIPFSWFVKFPWDK